MATASSGHSRRRPVRRGEGAVARRSGRSFSSTGTDEQPEAAAHELTDRPVDDSRDDTDIDTDTDTDIDIDIDIGIDTDIGIATAAGSLGTDVPAAAITDEDSLDEDSADEDSADEDSADEDSGAEDATDSDDEEPDAENSDSAETDHFDADDSDGDDTTLDDQSAERRSPDELSLGDRSPAADSPVHESDDDLSGPAPTTEETSTVSASASDSVAPLAAALKNLVAGVEHEVEVISGLSGDIDVHVEALNALRSDMAARLLHLDTLRDAAVDSHLGAYLDDTIVPTMPQAAEEFPERIYGEA